MKLILSLISLLLSFTVFSASRDDRELLYKECFDQYTPVAVYNSERWFSSLFDQNGVALDTWHVMKGACSRTKSFQFDSYDGNIVLVVSKSGYAEMEFDVFGVQRVKFRAKTSVSDYLKIKVCCSFDAGVTWSDGGEFKSDGRSEVNLSFLIPEGSDKNVRLKFIFPDTKVADARLYIDDIIFEGDLKYPAKFFFKEEYLSMSMRVPVKSLSDFLILYSETDKSAVELVSSNPDVAVVDTGWMLRCNSPGNAVIKAIYPTPEISYIDSFRLEVADIIEPLFKDGFEPESFTFKPSKAADVFKFYDPKQSDILPFEGDSYLMVENATFYSPEINAKGYSDLFLEMKLCGKELTAKTKLSVAVCKPGTTRYINQVNCIGTSSGTYDFTASSNLVSVEFDESGSAVESRKVGRLRIGNLPCDERLKIMITGTIEVGTAGKYNKFWAIDDFVIKGIPYLPLSTLSSPYSVEQLSDICNLGYSALYSGECFVSGVLAFDGPEAFIKSGSDENLRIPVSLSDGHEKVWRNLGDSDNEVVLIGKAVVSDDGCLFDVEDAILVDDGRFVVCAAMLPHITDGFNSSMVMTGKWTSEDIIRFDEILRGEGGAMRAFSGDDYVESDNSLSWMEHLDLSTAVFDNSKGLVDLLKGKSGLTSVRLNYIPEGFELPATDLNPNCIIYVMENFSGDIANVVLPQGRISKLEITDGYPFNLNQPVEVGRVSFIKRFGKESGIGESKGWESIALPFAPSRITAFNQNGDMVELFPFDSDGNIVNGKNPFWLKQLTDDGFVDTDTLRAYVPYIICMPNNDKYQSVFNIQGDVLFEAEGLLVDRSDDSPYFGIGFAYQMMYNFKNMDMDPNLYVLNDVGDLFVNDIQGPLPLQGYVEFFSGVKLNALSFSGNNIQTSALLMCADDSDKPSVIVADGDIVVYSQKLEFVDVYNIAGINVFRIYLSNGVGRMAKVPAGVYIVAGTKMVVY